jgi:hypothetical protein
LCAIRVHRIPPHVRDDRETPLSSGGTSGIKKVICMKREEEKFLKKGLDSPVEKQPDGQISRRRERLFIPPRGRNCMLEKYDYS